MPNEFTSIVPKGLGRNTPDRSTPDGALLEAINVRFRNGAWRGIGEKSATGWYAESLFILDGITYHPVLPVNTYIVHNVTNNNVYKILFTNGDFVQVVSMVLELAVGEVFNRFSHLGNVLLVFTDIKKHILYWDKISLTYKDLTFLPVPVVNVGDVAGASVDIPSISGTVDTSGGISLLKVAEYARGLIVSDYLKEVSKQRESSKIEGYVIVRLAYRLFDGSYILHSQPYLHHVGYCADAIPTMNFLPTEVGAFTVDLLGNMFAKLVVYYNFFGTGTFTLPDFESMGIVESLDVFCSKPVDGFDYNKELTDWTGAILGGISTNSPFNPPFNTEYIEKIMDGQLYKVHSIPVKDILLKIEHYDASGPYYSAKAGVVYPDMTKDVSANELMPVDNFSHHIIKSLADYQYNSRLHLADIDTIISAGFNNLYHSKFVEGIDDGFNATINNGYAQQKNLLLDADTRSKFLGSYITEQPYPNTTIQIYQQVWLNTDQGRKVITSEVQSSFVSGFDAHNIPDDFTYYTYMYTDTITKTALIFNPIISYPDYRAFKVRYYYMQGTNKLFLADYALKSLPAMNIAYYMSALITDDGSTGMFYPIRLALPDDVYSLTAMPTDNPIDDSIIHDTNRMQVSEFFNPFIWPAINSYRFGMVHNVLVAITGVQQAMSDSAFGQYPLYVFSQQGVFTIQQGTETLYQSIQPLNNEILLNRSCLISISGAIVFGTKEGLRIISGSQVEELSTDVEGSISNPLASNVFFIDALSGLRLPIINSFRSNVDFLTYLQGSKLFFDVENKEIIVSNTLCHPVLNDIFTTSLSDGGTGYAANDLFTVDGGTLLATGKVLTESSGVVLTYEILTAGTGYSVDSAIDTTATSGSGTGLKIDIDSLKNELIPLYNHSYSYSFYTKSWNTRTEMLFDLMNISGRQIVVKRSSAIDEPNLVYTYSLHYADVEVFTGGLCDYFLMQTRPVNLSNSANKHIARLLSMCNITTKDQEYAIQIVAGSNDLITWSVVSYVQYSGDISNMLNINPVGNFKYFIIVIAGERKEFILNQFDVEYKLKFNNKLR